jgi:S1-C subfamily serine protease
MNPSLRTRLGLAVTSGLLLIAASGCGALGLLVERSAAPAPRAATTPQPPASAAPATTPGTTTRAPASDGVLELQNRLMEVAEQVAPSVVSIQTLNQQASGEGSGFIFAPDGKIVTNNHVVAGARQIQVTFADGRRAPARLLGGDAYFDLAVLQVESNEPLPALPLGDSSALRVGQFVIALGNPLGYDHTVTMGVISAINRPISDVGNAVARAMLQTDAAINPGNSGGPLVTLDGRVVGVNTQIAVQPGQRIPAQGLGFAVPSNVVQRVVPQLIQFGEVRNTGRAWLGISVGTVTEALARSYRLDSPFGAVVNQVTPNGPAARAGIQNQDIIVALNGQQVFGSDKLIEALITRTPGEQVRIEVVRPGGERRTLNVTLGEAPQVSPTARP